MSTLDSSKESDLNYLGVQYRELASPARQNCPLSLWLELCVKVRGTSNSIRGIVVVYGTTLQPYGI